MDNTKVGICGHLEGSVKFFNEIPEIEYTQLLPVEILTKIFTVLKNQSGTNNEDMAKLREVCKRWRDVVDDNCDFSAHLSNNTLQGPTIKHLRINTLTVDDFYIPPNRNQCLFRNLVHVKQLLLSGKVSRHNFLWLITQLSNLDYLSLSSNFLQNNIHLLIPNNWNEEFILNKFWANIKAIECVAVYMYTRNDLNVSKNFTQVLSADMPTLRSLKILAPWSLDFHFLLFSFLLRHPSVSKIHLVLNDIIRYLVETSRPEMKNLEKIQLKNILYTTHCRDGESHQKIMEFIKCQRSLEELYISSFTNVCVDVLDLGDFFRTNQATLTSLNLVDIVFKVTLDATIFQKLVNLKKLTLGKGEYDENESPQYLIFPELVNLTSLPSSLQKLVIRNISCEKQDMHDMVVSKQLENLRCLNLHKVGHGMMTPGFLYVLVMKKGLQKLRLSPLDLRHFQVEKRNEKKFIICANGYLLPVVDDDATLAVDFNNLEIL